MKTRFHAETGRRLGVGSRLLTVTLLALAPLAAKADTSFTCTSYLCQVPAPGILVTNSLGQVMLKGNVHALALQGSDPRVTGRMQADMDLAYQADGTALFSGQAFIEVGTWQNQTNFTATGGLWVMNYGGVAQADNSDQLNMTGYGLGGNIDGLRLQATAARGPGPMLDPTIPYQTSGLIQSAPLVMTVPIDVAKAPNWPMVFPGPNGALVVTNSQLTFRARWPGIATHYLTDTAAWASPEVGATVTQGRTLEARVDLVQLNDAAATAALAIYHGVGVGYCLAKSRDSISLGKQTANGMTYLSCERVTTANTNRILALSVTPSGQDVILTVRVLDPDHNEAAEYARTIVDTPASDPSLTAAQLQQLTGMTLAGIVNDPVGAPWTTFESPWLGLLQYTDGTLPAAEVTYANFQMRRYDIPPVSISRAVQITVPRAAGTSYSVERALTPNGPWLPVNDLTLPSVQSFTLPATKNAEFLRAVLAP